MKTPKFAVGDEVRMGREYGGNAGVEPGQIVTITKVLFGFTGSGIGYRINAGRNSGAIAWDESWFEPLNPPAPEPSGFRVLVTTLHPQGEGFGGPGPKRWQGEVAKRSHVFEQEDGSWVVKGRAHTRVSTRPLQTGEEPRTWPVPKRITVFPTGEVVRVDLTPIVD